MNCAQFVELVTDFLDGSMGEPTELRCLVHLARCEGCETYLEQFRQTLAAVGAPPGPDLPSVARDQLLGAHRSLPRG
ncbi:zf-HC2 domain-containing protein [Streptomyces sp. HNM0645]|uniref:anti-sigma factor family protein n=1 Tax=Streptomyces sp. HNM0645 TaxID=2782343 RepID=UPI0024B82B4D|nr:zf-HC2 domain-containing protein [Streptomyces sp. HNM0645]MDI9889450.1 zf-HC2 domain-containing protein [Streptomyces sp. HNM0645]